MLSTALFAAGSGTLAAGGSEQLPAPPQRVKSISITSTCAGTIFCFSPMSPSVATGRQVVWTNTTFAPHILALCDPAACGGVTSGTGTDAGFGSGVIGSEQTYAFTFHGTGTYTYYCSIHGYATMHGTITVDPLPTITSPPRMTLAAGTTNATVLVAGTGFRRNAVASVSGTGVTVSSVVVVDDMHLMLTVSVAATSGVGTHKLTVKNADGGVAARNAAILVTAPAS